MLLRHHARCENKAVLLLHDSNWNFSWTRFVSPAECVINFQYSSALHTDVAAAMCYTFALRSLFFTVTRSLLLSPSFFKSIKNAISSHQGATPRLTNTKWKKRILALSVSHFVDIAQRVLSMTVDLIWTSLSLVTPAAVNSCCISNPYTSQTYNHVWAFFSNTHQFTAQR